MYNPDREGYLYKLSTGRVRGWKRRWVVLTEKVKLIALFKSDSQLNVSQTLYYFDNPTDREPKGIIPLNNVQVRNVQDKNRNYCFELFQNIEGSHMLTIKVVIINVAKKVKTVFLACKNE